jgi:F0F1-type ATP synthase assembly protein I
MSEDHRRDLGEAWTLAFALVGFVVVFLGLGLLVDRWAGTEPWFMIGGVLAGAVLGFVYLVSVLFSRSSKGRDGGSGTQTGEDQE